MSGSAALASARRRRAIPQKPENEIVETPKQQLTQPMPQQPIAANPTALLIKHNGLLGGIQNDIENLKKQLTDIKVPNTSNVDEKSTLEFYKSQHTILLEKNELKLYNKLLTNYRYVDEIDELRYGSYIRWFNLSKPKSLKLLNGGFIVDIKNNNGNIIILCKNGLNKFFNLKMSESFIFQKNTRQDEVLIKILDHLQSIEG